MATLTASANAAASALTAIAAAGGVGPTATSGGFDYSFGGAGVPLAEGINRVPYDGYRAVLHKDEAVQPAKYNPAVGGAGGRAQVVNIHPAPNTEATTQQNDDGSVDVFMKQTEKFMAGRIATGRSPVNTGLKARGLNTSGGLAKRG